MTDKEIVKCAEKCIEDIPHCGVCPFDKDSIATSECMGEVIKNLLNIINRLQDEREALINGQETLQKTIVEQRAENKEIWEERNRIYESFKETSEELEEYRKAYVNQQAEIEELKCKNSNLTSLQKDLTSSKAEVERLQRPQDADPMDFCGVLCNFAEELIAKAKTEAYKEFAKRLIRNYSVNFSRKDCFMWAVDNLLNELVGE